MIFYEEGWWKMNNLWIFGIVIIAIILGRAIFYQYKISYLKKSRNIYKSYLNSYNVENESIDMNLREKLLNEKSEIKNLFNKAEIVSASDSYMKIVGMGYVKEQSIQFIENIHIPNNAKITSFFKNAFAEAIGFYKKRRNESFSIFFWILYIINLPKHFFQFYGKEPKGSLYVLIDTIYKIAFIFGIIYAIVTGISLI